MTREEAIVLNVIERLQTAGAFHEARIVASLAGEERALLVLRESGWGMDLHPPAVHRTVPRVRSLPLRAPSGPHDTDAEVAA